MHNPLKVVKILLLCVLLSYPAFCSETLLFSTVKEAEQIKIMIKHGMLDKQAEHLRSLAENQSPKGPWSVTDHPSPAASGNPHDFFSEGPYWWPDPANPDGPYIRRDGRSNPNRFTWHDNDLGRLSNAVLTLGLAGYLLDEKKYVDRADLLITTWFLDEKTKMNPHLEYGQAIQGRTTGRGIGLIDTRSSISIVQGVLFMDQTGWDPSKKKQLQEWYAKFLHWMTHDEKGLDEMRHGNNHSTWWATQVAAYSFFTGNHQQLEQVWDLYKNFLVPHQFKPDGRAPLEEARTKSLSYSYMNIKGFTQLCRIAQLQGVNLWDYKTEEGKSLKKAIAYLTPFLLNPSTWENEQIQPLHLKRSEFFLFASLGYTNPTYFEIYQSLEPGDDIWALFLDMLASAKQSDFE